MKQIGGGKDCTLTRGDLAGMPSTPGTCPGQLNSQKSAEAIVLYLLETIGEGLNQ
ncbi:hypothetical protein V1498_12825 [Peribacillus sp. SCS-26]|uniref:hypothetical protein n=1 Tax=Paraperibacillus marinus TaxID=3115295 RepID=UPI003905F507